MYTAGCHSEEPFGLLRVNSATKNLEILRYTQDDIVSFFAEFILPVPCAIHWEPVEGLLRMTNRAFRMDTNWSML